MEKPIYIAIFFFIVICLVLLRLAIVQHMFFKYLREEHYEKWQYLTTLSGGMGPGMQNSFRALPFLFSKEDLGDKKVVHYKTKIRNLLLYVLTGFIAMIVTLMIGFCSAVVSQILQ